MGYPNSRYGNILLPVEQSTMDSAQADISVSDASGASIMLTGAPATGKSTIMRELMRHHNYTPSPDITTRSIRPDEVNGIDKRFVTTEEFIKLYDNNQIVEDDLDYCVYQGNYYGSPIEWLESQQLGESKVLTCVALKIAEVVRRHNKDIFWVHLESEGMDRAERLALRGLSQVAIAKRLSNSGGESHLRPEGVDMSINTSIFDLSQAINLILEASQNER